MSKELSPADLINQVNDIKARVLSLDNSSRVYYEIWGFNPVSSPEFQSYGKGNNKTEKCYSKFESDLDRLLASPNVVQIKITLKDGRKDLGNSELTLKPAYQSVTPTVLPAKMEKAEVAQAQTPTAQPQPQQTPFNGVGFLKLLGFGEMLNGVDDDFGGLGSVLAIRDKLIENRFVQLDKDRQINSVIEENAVLKHKNKELENKIEQLSGEIDEYESSIGDLEDKIAEYEKLNPKRNIISGLAGSILENSLLGFVSKTKYAGLLGLGETDAIPTATPTMSSQPIQIEEVDETPRGKAKQQITAWIDTLDDTEFSALYQLLTLFAKGATPIASCLQWAAQPTTTQPIPFDDDDDNNDKE